jgi:hypothetical protein
MPARGDELMTSRGLVTVLLWDCWQCDVANVDVVINGYDGTTTYETWYDVPVKMLDYLGLTAINTTYNKVK